VTYAALWDFMQDFQARELGAWEAFQASRQDRPYPHPRHLATGETSAKQRELEERYFSPAMREKYRLSPGQETGA
jgi:hypothetical protein